MRRNSSANSGLQSRRSSGSAPEQEKQDASYDDFDPEDTTFLKNVSSIHQKSGLSSSNNNDNNNSATFGSNSFNMSKSYKSRSGTALQTKRLALPAGNKAPPALVSRNVIIDRYSELERDSKQHDRLFQRAASNTLPHTPTTMERERTQRRRIQDQAGKKKRVNADLPHEVSVGGVGRDLTLLNIVQQLDLNACGSDSCAMPIKAARHAHVTDVVAHSQSQFHWRANPFAKVVKVDRGADATAAGLVDSTAAQRKRLLLQEQQQQQEGQGQQPPRATFSFNDDDDDDSDEEAQAQLLQVQNQFQVSQAVLSGALAKSNVRTLPVTDRSVRTHRDDVAPSDIAKAKRAGALESRLRHRLHLIIEEERRQHHAEQFRSGELAKDEDLVMGGVDDPDAPRNPIIVNREASWLRAIFVGIFASELKGQIEEVKATKLLRRVFAREMYRYLRRKRVVHERDLFERRMKQSAFTTSSAASSASPLVDMSNIPGAEVVTVVTAGPDGERIEKAELRPSTALLLKCFPILKLDPEGYASPAVLLAAALAQRRGAPLGKVIGVNDEGIHGMPRMRISPEHLRLLGSIFKPAVFKKREPILWSAPPPLSSSSADSAAAAASSSYLYQQQQQQQQPRTSNDTDWWEEVDDHVHLIQSGIVRMVYRRQRRQQTPASAAHKEEGGGGGKEKADMPSALTRRCISGVETLTPGHVIGLELLVPEQAKRFVAIADSDVATWSAPIKDLVLVLEEINPFGDPDAEEAPGIGAGGAGAGGPGVGAGARKRRKDAAAAAAAAAGGGGVAGAGGGIVAPVLDTPEKLLSHKIERDCCIMLGRMLARMVLLRKQEIFLVQTPPTPAFLRSCAPLLHTWSDGGLTEVCRALDAVFVEKGTVVPLRKDRPNRGYQWFYAGGAAAVGEGITIPPTTAPPSHVDYVYFVVHGGVAIMGRKVFEGKGKQDGPMSPPGSPVNTSGGGGRGGGTQKLVLLDTIKPGQSYGVPSCLLGTLLDTAIPSAICAAISASGTPTSSSGKGALSKAAAAAALVSSATGGSGASSDSVIVSNAAPVVLSSALATNILPSQLSHLVGVELHATQDAVVWKLSKNVLMHVLAHEHIGTLLSPYTLYQQQHKQAGQ